MEMLRAMWPGGPRQNYTRCPIVYPLNLFWMEHREKKSRYAIWTFPKTPWLRTHLGIMCIRPIINQTRLLECFIRDIIYQKTEPNELYNCWMPKMIGTKNLFPK